ncbi:MAG: FAD-dependent monooxygenase [Gammaproteobacteria bacterium]|nr:FAD-dependent monooxygenase [Gammaproteobacteria bacterium]
MPRPFDIVVAGAGLIGTAAACLFARQGLDVALVETQPADRGRGHENSDRRISAINVAAAALLRALEVWPGGAPGRIGDYRAMRVWDRNSPAKISFHAADLGEPCLGYIIDNRLMIALMREKLRQNYNVTILDNTEITAIDRRGDRAPDRSHPGLSVDLSGERIETRLLVGADGAHSRVRALCGLSARRRDFGQDALISTVSTARSHRHTAWQCFLETGPVAMLPLADGRCALVWSCERATADRLMDLPTADFCARLQSVFFDELGEIADCQPRQRFALHQHHANPYIADAVALVGDAAHTIHPLAGLGANIGLMDAAALAEVVQQARGRGADPGQYSVLRRYQRWRRGDNALVVAMTAGFKEVFGSSRTSVKALRCAGMNLADSITPLKVVLARFATGLSGDLPALCRRHV